MHTTFTSILESAVSRYIALDPETQKRLSALSGKVLKIEVSDWERAFYITPHATGMTVKRQHDKNPDATIKGTSLTFIRLHFASEETTVALAKQLEITGDIHLAQTFNHILKQLDVDWEEQLSKFTGDSIAFQIGKFARGIRGWGKQVRRSMGLNITEYLQEETNHLPTREEIENFFSDIRRLQEDVDRLEVRLSPPPSNRSNR